MRTLATLALTLTAGCFAPEALPVRAHGPLPGGFEAGAAFWGLEVVEVETPRGAVTVRVFEHAPPRHRNHAGWGGVDSLCKSHAGVTEAWAGSWQINAHEIGHAAGLGHSDDPDNVMHQWAGFTADLYATDEQVDTVIDRARDLWRFCP